MSAKDKPAEIDLSVKPARGEIGLPLHQKDIDGFHSTVAPRWLDRAKKRLEQLFRMADADEVDGSRFHGEIAVHVAFKNGDPTTVKSGYGVTDKLTLEK